MWLETNKESQLKRSNEISLVFYFIQKTIFRKEKTFRIKIETNKKFSKSKENDLI